MFDISKRMDDRLVLNGKEYQLFLSFDNVLKVFEMWSDDRFPVQIKPQLALVKLTDNPEFRHLDFETALNIYSEIFEKHIKSVKPSDAVERYDLEGNVIPKKPKDSTDDEKPLYSLKYDSEFIFSSFMQAYNIDLIEEQGKIALAEIQCFIVWFTRWNKANWSYEKSEIGSHRKAKAQKKNKKMRELQEEYALPEE